VSAVTAATKRIEADISSGVWGKQKRWEMKREVLFEAAKRLAEVEEAMLTYATAIRQDHAKQSAWETAAPTLTEKLSWTQVMSEATTGWSKASAAFDETRLFVGIVCGKDAKEAFEDLGRFINVLVVQIRKAPDAYQSSRPDFINKVLVSRNAIRKELEVDA
jgi:hypothetical protein